ncbi:hypothetical protein [Halomicrobium salinisoli]|uniref:hypothetical protein n=1 Tax=Halomicrobium salinisoli TaxID=2878391 RepID=UPI001CEFDB94|nr:hypothetical protein [Halomicrobium salinisoli]
MRRRTLLRSLGASAAAFGAGCLGLGGEVVVSVQQSVRVPAGEGWSRELPDVSDSGGAISYEATSEDESFDVYLFQAEQFRYYDEYVKGRDPERTPKGIEQFSKVAVETDGGVYEAATANGGARESLDAAGPYHFVVDHSNYRLGHRMDDHADELSAFVELELVEDRI